MLPAPKMTLLSRLKNELSPSQAHFLALVRTRVADTAVGAGQSEVVQIRVDAEVYDLATDEYVAGFERSPVRQRVSAECLRSTACVSESVGERLAESAAALAKTLASMVERVYGKTAGG